MALACLASAPTGRTRFLVAAHEVGGERKKTETAAAAEDINAEPEPDDA